MFTPIGYFAPTGGEIVTTNLEQWLQVETGTEAGTLADSSGNGNNATLVNSELVYNTTNDWWDIDATDWTPEIDTNFRYSDYLATSWTFECWFNITSVASFPSMIHNRDGLYGDNFVAFGINFAAGELSLTILNTAAGEYNVKGNNGSSVVDSAWHHGCGMYDYSANEMIVYLDGQEVGTRVSPTGASNRAVDLHYMGKFVNSSRYWSNASFGSMRIYSAALSASEVLQNYNAEKAHYGL